MISNKNKSENGELHKCDHCGISPEEIWTGAGIEGQYCLEHFKQAHDSPEEFDEWYTRFNK